MSYLISQLKNFIPTIIIDNYRMFKYTLLKEKTLKKWEKNGCPIPPPHVVKQKIIREYRFKYNLNIFVETGTYLGDMIAAKKKYFTKIYSIELSNELWQRAKKRFERHKNIIILQGDSSLILEDVVDKLNEPALFYLDGHYSGGITAGSELGCPIKNELKAIFRSNIKKHIILIDDARAFGSEKNYPSLSDLIHFIKSYSPHSNVEIKHDIIRVTP